MQKRKAIIFGNCQAAAVATILGAHDEFRDQFEIVPVRSVHALTMPERERLLVEAQEADLLIHQPVSNVYQPASTENLLAAVNPEAPIISFPVCWFDGYFPDMVQLKTNGAKAESILFPYHSRVMFYAYLAGLKTGDAAAIYNAPKLYTEAFLHENVAKNLRNLRTRETDLDIKIADFIEQHYRYKRLFFTFNHPTGHVLFFIVDDILRRLNLSPFGPEAKRKFGSLLGRHRWQDSPSVVRELQLQFSQASTFLARQERLSAVAFAEHYFRSYDDNPALVSANTSLPRNGLQLV